VLDKERLRSMSPQERLELFRALVPLIDLDHVGGTAGGGRRRALALAFVIACCVVLAAWIGVLAVTLPRYYRAGAWRGAWVGFDIALLAVFAATGWALWRRRQVLIVCLVVLATLLCCDAWFDVVLDARTGQFWLSVASALVVELPIAALAAAGARRLLRRTVRILRLYQGDLGPVPPLHRLHLHGARGRALRDIFAQPAAAGPRGTGLRERDGPGGPGA
jgi:hypothetical protein